VAANRHEEAASAEEGRGKSVVQPRHQCYGVQELVDKKKKKIEGSRVEFNRSRFDRMYASARINATRLRLHHRPALRPVYYA